MGVEIEKRQRFSTTDTRKAIESWFLEHYLDSPEKLRQSKTWQTIRKYIDKMGHYKAKKRGKSDYNIHNRLIGSAYSELNNGAYLE